ncbi:MAG: molecular chaperone HtpG [Bdellovibrionaceae bacterium]|jgi:molecular chaperone HtpG|nr:molecular chaperone HtpG [Pseudobdellovibrionaceae bacterium]
MAKQQHVFQTEVKEILDLMIHSLYSQREIFMRELVSNASDALDKLRYEALTNTDWKLNGAEIRINTDKDQKTISISDTGIGMSFDEVQENIGTIAHSGTKDFLKNAKNIKESPELIGQFGVGFYSSFMVADKVTLHTQKAGTSEGVLWESTGDGNYSIDSVPRAQGHGTTITLHLKETNTTEDKPQDFTDEWTIKSLIKKYSDFIEFPVKMKTVNEVPELDDEGKPIEGKTKKEESDDTLNSQKALWLKSPSEITPEEHKEFYSHVAHDWAEPLKTIHFKAEGMQEFTSLLYIPSNVPFNYFHRGSEFGPELYVKRVFIMKDCQDLIAPYLRFVKGVVDSSDLSLNVSREILQQDHQAQGIKKALVNKILKELKTTLEKDRESYVKFWNNFGSTFKEGIATDSENKEKIEKISMFYSTNSDELTTLQEYVDRMKEGQKDIYMLTGDDLDHLKTSPYLEKLKEKGYEVLLLTDHVDEWVAESLTKFADKNIVSITKENLDLDTEEDKKKSEEELKENETKYSALKDIIKKALDSDVQDVKLSNRLTNTPVCLVQASNAPSARMEKLMESMGQKPPKSKRILEINPKHPVIEKMLASEKETQSDWAEILYNQALLNEGSPLKNPHEFSEKISKLMMN